MRLILTRHGETEENKLGILQGHLHGTLSEEGVEQAERLAKRLKDENIDVVYSSDLDRASNTTKKIVIYHPDVPVHYIQSLRERNLGKFQGKNKHELKVQNVLWADAEDSEPLEDLHSRAKNFLKMLLEKHPNETILCVAHNGINKAITSAIIGKDYLYIKEMKNYGNTSVTIFDISPNGYELKLDNCMKHLENTEIKVSE